MKRHYAFILAAALAAAPIAFTACTDDESTSTNTPGGEGQTATTDAQKQKLETVAKAFMEETAAQNMESLNTLAKHIATAYIDNENFDNSKVERVFEDIFDGMLSEPTKSETESDSYTGYDNYGRKYTYTVFYTEEWYERVIDLSQFKGHFRAGKTDWTYETADDLAFYFENAAGQECVLSIKPSGNTKKVYVGEDGEYESGYSYDYATGKYSDMHYYESYEDGYVLVPERIDLTLTENGRTVISHALTIDHSQFSSGTKEMPYNFSKDGLTVKAEARVGDYTWTVESAHNGKAGTGSLKGSLAHGAKTLATLDAGAADIRVNKDNDALTGFGATSFGIDIMGGVQIKGTTPDIKKLISMCEDADDCDDEAACRAAVAKINDMADIGVYYDGTATRQATIKAAAISEENVRYVWNHYAGRYNTYTETEWNCMPVIAFADGSTYTIFDEDSYFSEERFAATIDAFLDMLDAYEKLLKWTE